MFEITDMKLLTDTWYPFADDQVLASVVQDVTNPEVNLLIILLQPRAFTFVGSKWGDDARLCGLKPIQQQWVQLKNRGPTPTDYWTRTVTFKGDVPKCWYESMNFPDLFLGVTDSYCIMPEGAVVLNSQFATFWPRRTRQHKGQKW